MVPNALAVSGREGVLWTVLHSRAINYNVPLEDDGCRYLLLVSNDIHEVLHAEVPLHNRMAFHLDLALDPTQEPLVAVPPSEDDGLVYDFSSTKDETEDDNFPSSSPSLAAHDTPVTRTT